MPISAGELAQIVWAETGDLGVADADGSGDINKVRRLLAQLAASASGVGFNKRRSVPLTTDNFYGGTATAIMKIADDAKDLTAPQSHLIIWDAGPDQSKLNPATKPPPPEPWASVNPNTITNQLHYTLPSGRAVDVFSRAVPPGADAALLWSTPLPEPACRAARWQQQQPPTRPRNLPTTEWLGFSALLACSFS
jgi:hypothetical protein